MKALHNDDLKKTGELIRQAKQELALAKKTGDASRVGHAFRRLQRARVEAAHVRRYRARVHDDLFGLLVTAERSVAQ